MGLEGLLDGMGLLSSPLRDMMHALKTSHGSQAEVLEKLVSRLLDGMVKTTRRKSGNKTLG